MIYDIHYMYIDTISNFFRFLEQIFNLSGRTSPWMLSGSVLGDAQYVYRIYVYTVYNMDFETSTYIV